MRTILAATIFSPSLFVEAIVGGEKDVLSLLPSSQICAEVIGQGTFSVFMAARILSKEGKHQLEIKHYHTGTFGGQNEFNELRQKLDGAYEFTTAALDNDGRLSFIGDTPNGFQVTPEDKLSWLVGGTRLHAKHCDVINDILEYGQGLIPNVMRNLRLALQVFPTEQGKNKMEGKRGMLIWKEIKKAAVLKGRTLREAKLRFASLPKPDTVSPLVSGTYMGMVDAEHIFEEQGQATFVLQVETKKKKIQLYADIDFENFGDDDDPLVAVFSSYENINDMIYLEEEAIVLWFDGESFQVYMDAQAFTLTRQ